MCGCGNSAPLAAHPLYADAPALVVRFPTLPPGSRGASSPSIALIKPRRSALPVLVDQSAEGLDDVESGHRVGSRRRGQGGAGVGCLPGAAGDCEMALVLVKGGAACCSW